MVVLAEDFWVAGWAELLVLTVWRVLMWRGAGTWYLPSTPYFVPWTQRCATVWLVGSVGRAEIQHLHAAVSTNTRHKSGDRAWGSEGRGRRSRVEPREQRGTAGTRSSTRPTTSVGRWTAGRNTGRHPLGLSWAVFCLSPGRGDWHWVGVIGTAQAMPTGRGDAIVTKHWPSFRSSSRISISIDATPQHAAVSEVCHGAETRHEVAAQVTRIILSLIHI